ncbi:MAG: dimethylarginine dimethylaminohydrolase family protein [Planctomycetota bacterium]
MTLSYQSDVGAIRSLVIKHARDAFVSDEAIDRQWRDLGYVGRPDFARAVDEYDRFVALLEGFGIDIHFLPQDERVGLDSLYPRDAAISCDKGMIFCNMGKPQRCAEPAAAEAAFRAIGIPVHGAITGDGRIEGGDVAWLDKRTLAVGRGYRTNDEGIRQLRELLGDCIDELIVVPLPHWRGPGDVFHLMSILSPIDHDLALVYSPLMPVPFREALLSRGMELVEVPESEFETMGCNVLAVAPRKCVMLTGNRQTRTRLEAAGAEVHVFEGREISVNGAGGPTCLTRPILREG